MMGALTVRLDPVGGLMPRGRQVRRMMVIVDRFVTIQFTDHIHFDQIDPFDQVHLDRNSRFDLLFNHPLRVMVTVGSHRLGRRVRAILNDPTNLDLIDPDLDRPDR